MKIILVFAVCAFIHFTYTTGNYEIIPERLETAFANDDQLFSFETLRVKKFNRTTFVVNGIFTVKQSLGEDIDGFGIGLNHQGGQYKKMVEKTFINFCETLYMEGSRTFFENYQSHTTNPVPWKTCPYPAGTNEVKNFYVDDRLLLLPPYIPGSEKWKVELRFSREGVVLGGYNIYAVLRNEASLLGH